jgi:hypothetical protein
VGWTFLYLMLFLKLPILGLLGIVWWAIRQEPEPADSGQDGGAKHPPHPRRPRPRRGGPRRGPHGAPPPTSPPRVRTTVARARRVSH